VALCRPRLAPRLAPANERKERRYGSLGSSRDLVRAQRDKLAELYRDGEIGDDTRLVISRPLDPAGTTVVRLAGGGGQDTEWVMVAV
jgi:hypothetical protein